MKRRNLLLRFECPKTFHAAAPPLSTQSQMRLLFSLQPLIPSPLTTHNVDLGWYLRLRAYILLWYEKNILSSEVSRKWRVRECGWSFECFNSSKKESEKNFFFRGLKLKNSQKFIRLFSFWLVCRIKEHGNFFFS